MSTENEKEQRRIILDENKSMREGHTRVEQPRKFDWGFAEFRIPMQDYAALKLVHPDLFSPDAETARKAWEAFRWHPHSEQYRVVRSPQQVQRSMKKALNR